MNRLGQLLRNFRRKLAQNYILPNQNTPSKQNEVPAKYSAIIKAEDWINFVKYTATEEYKVLISHFYSSLSIFHIYISSIMSTLIHIHAL